MTCAALAVWWAAVAAPASALELLAPAESGAAAPVTVRSAASDPAGTVSLTVDGVTVAAASLSPGSEVPFAVALTPGRHTVGAVLASGADTVTAAPVEVLSWGTPAAPVLVKPTGGYAARYCDPVVKAGDWTSVVYLFVNGSLAARIPCAPGQQVAFPRVTLAAGVSTFHVVAANPYGVETKATWSVRRLDYPWPTCIVVDKSEYRLYWVKDGVLVKTYRIAHGKPRTPTPNAVWIVGAKEKRDPRGVYGPRRLRIYRRVGWDAARKRYRYQIRQFGIHGTNQPWVIGTMASHGCIRLVNKDILELWPQVPVGTPVLTRP